MGKDKFEKRAAKIFGIWYNSFGARDVFFTLDIQSTLIAIIADGLETEYKRGQRKERKAHSMYGF